MSDLAQIYGEAVRDYQPTGPGTEQAAHLAGLQAVRRAVLLEAAEVSRSYARKWWSIHCATNKHMETTRRAHDDFCALDAALRQMAGEK